MQTLTLKIKDIQNLNEIKKSLSDKQPLTEKQQTNLIHFLSQLPQTENLFLEQTSLDEQFDARLWEVGKIDNHLDQWERLFGNLPGWDYCPICAVVDNDNVEMLRKNVIMFAVFAPSYAYNCIRSSEERGYEVWLKDDGTAQFHVPTLTDAEAYPELYNFKGTWKEAYYILIETLKKGWPMEEFPEELLPLLKK